MISSPAAARGSAEAVGELSYRTSSKPLKSRQPNVTPVESSCLKKMSLATPKPKTVVSRKIL